MQQSTETAEAVVPHVALLLRMLPTLSLFVLFAGWLLTNSSCLTGKSSACVSSVVLLAYTAVAFILERELLNGLAKRLVFFTTHAYDYLRRFAKTFRGGQQTRGQWQRPEEVPLTEADREWFESLYQKMK